MALDPITINGSDIQQPTDHGWQQPAAIGEGGAGNLIVPGVWSYAFTWNYMTPADFQTIWNLWFNNQGADITADLPQIGASTYILYTYIGRLNPVIHSGFFEGHWQQVRTSIVGIDITA